MVKNLPANEGDHKRYGLDPWVKKKPWRRAWKPTPVFLPGESHGHRSLVGYSPGGCKESDMTEQLTHAREYRTSLDQHGVFYTLYIFSRY